jgi:Zn-dependent M28 family amino/carboxypeptidase
MTHPPPTLIENILQSTKEGTMKARHYSLNVLFTVFMILVLVVPTVLAGNGSSDIKALYKRDKVMAQEQALVGFGPRVAGGPAEKAAADYIAAQMESYGLDVEIQEFGILYFEELSSPVLEETSPTPMTYVEGTDFATMSYSGSGDVTADIQAVDLLIPPTGGSTSGCEADDFVGFGAGNIALMQRGTCTFGEKAANALAAGAVGAIIFNEGNAADRTGLLFGTLGGPVGEIPVVGTTFALGEGLYNQLSSGPVQVHMVVDAISEERTSQDVIGTLVGTKPDQGIVYIGGHYDSVSAGVGANDDASGVAAMLEAARVLSDKGHRTKATLKFIAFGSEETGLDGSYNYIDANYDEVSTKGIGMVNLDMVAVGDILQIGNIDYGIPGTGGNQIKEYAQQKATAMGISWEPFQAGENSDHTYFEQVGVPAVFLTQSPDPYYHTAQDSLDKIQAATLEANGELATATMYDWAKNPVLRAKKAAHFEKVNVYHDKVHAKK